jgi:hypothetical protein
MGTWIKTKAQMGAAQQRTGQMMLEGMGMQPCTSKLGNSLTPRDRVQGKGWLSRQQLCEAFMVIREKEMIGTLGIQERFLGPYIVPEPSLPVCLSLLPHPAGSKSPA